VNVALGIAGFEIGNWRYHELNSLMAPPPPGIGR
jgi:hypothetical protein